MPIFDEPDRMAQLIESVQIMVRSNFEVINRLDRTIGLMETLVSAGEARAFEPSTEIEHWSVEDAGPAYVNQTEWVGREPSDWKIKDKP